MKKSKTVSDVAKKVGENLQFARKQKGYTQKQFAEKLCKYQSDYSDYECGKIQLDDENIIFVCRELDISPNDLFEDLF